MSAVQPTPGPSILVPTDHGKLSVPKLCDLSQRMGGNFKKDIIGMMVWNIGLVWGNDG
jgi:hypothetical protein